MSRKGVRTRPLKFKTVATLERKMQKYFDSCFEEQWFDEIDRDEFGNKTVDANGKYVYKPVKRRVQIKPISITGLAVALDTSRHVLVNYETMGMDSDYVSVKPEIKAKFINAIKKAKIFIENFLEDGMLKSDINPAVGIFVAKNNFGWQDQTNVKQETNLNVRSKEQKELIEKALSDL